MPTVVATPGVSNANSYVTRAEADTYFDERLHASAWTSATNDNKDRAVIMATRTIDGFVCFTGTSTGDGKLRWPMSGMLDRNGNAIDDDVIPDELKQATFEMALLLLVSDRTLESDAAAKGLTKIKAGPVELQFKDEITINTVPDGVRSLFPESWLCEEEGASVIFEVL